MRQAIEKLTDIVETMVADGDLNDLEIEFLKAWLAENPDLAQVWPASAVSGAVETVLADGHVNEEERAYLMRTLRELVAGEFAPAEAEQKGDDALALLFDNSIEIILRDSLVYLAGDFLHGTRTACERLLEKAGAWPAASVSQNVRYVVVGSKVPTNWTQTPIGQTIRNALSLQKAGHAIAIVSERRWLKCFAG